jgi:hypothetical protein
MKNLFLLALIVIMIGCAAQQPSVIWLHTKFDPAQAAYSREKGENVIKGQGFMRTRGGEIRTCAGSRVSLVPITDYSEERMMYLYNIPSSSETRYTPWHERYKTTFAYTDPEYEKFFITTYCDAQGNFLFENIADGDYFLATRVMWEAPYCVGLNCNNMFQGGDLMQRISVSGGGIRTIYLTPQ